MGIMIAAQLPLLLLSISAGVSIQVTPTGIVCWWATFAVLYDAGRKELEEEVVDRQVPYAVPTCVSPSNAGGLGGSSGRILR